jgi:hypothetical protein
MEKSGGEGFELFLLTFVLFMGNSRIAPLSNRW